MAERQQGWAVPLGANRAHYVADGRTLCGHWLYRGPLAEEPPRLPCRTCEDRVAEGQAA